MLTRDCLDKHQFNVATTNVQIVEAIYNARSVTTKNAIMSKSLFRLVLVL